MSPLLILFLAPAVLAVALSASPYVLILVDLVLVVISEGWNLGGIHIDVTDFVLLGVVISLVVHPAVWRRRPRIPYFYVWLLLGVLSSIAYLAAPMNQRYLTDPLRIAYQLYRYAWKPFLYYPLTIILLTDGRKQQAALLAVIIGADLAAVPAIQQGYAGGPASGPFSHANLLGSAMIVPSMLCLAGVLSSATRRQRLFYGASGLALARALLFTGSRGAFVATLASSAFMLVWLFAKAQSRTRVQRLVGIGVLLAGVLLVMKPDVWERPTVQRMLSVSQGTAADSFQWRLHERWPHFLGIVEDNPWFGVGTEVDPSLGENADTPHNGYLAIALIYGVPALLLVVAFALLGIRDALRVYAGAKDRFQSIFGVTLAAALIGVLVHNIGEATLYQPFLSKSFWLLVGMATIAARRPALLLANARRSTAVASEVFQDTGRRFTPVEA